MLENYLPYERVCFNCKFWEMKKFGSDPEFQKKYSTRPAAFGKCLQGAGGTLAGSKCTAYDKVGNEKFEPVPEGK